LSDWQRGFVRFPPEDDPAELVAIALCAALFGLHAFCSEDVVADNDELLGTLEMYCSDQRGPTASDFQLIERAKCLVALAITLDNEADQHPIGRVLQSTPVREHLHKGPVYLN